MTALLAQSMWMPDGPTMRLVAPELLLIATAVAVLLAPLLTSRSTGMTWMIALVGGVLAGLAAAWTAGDVPPDGIELFGVTGPDGEVGNGMILVDSLSGFFRIFLMLFLAAIIFMWTMFDAEREQHAPEFFTLLIVSALGMALMVGTTNLLMMIIAIEMASLPSYAMAGFDKYRRIASEASVKYVVFGAATSGFMIYGTSILFGVTGTLHIPTLIAQLAQIESLSPAIGLALLAVFAGIAFKISAVPFHYWCPDVFQGASLPVATWLSVPSKAAGLILLLRIVFWFSGEAGFAASEAYATTLLPMISYGVGFFAILTCTFANLAAYRQTNVRRMLAYSSIAHAGYMLMAGAIVVQGEAYASAMSAVVAYVFIYLFMNLGAFMMLGLVASDAGSEELSAFSGVGWRDWPVGIGMTFCLVSLVGLPPLGGFLVKWWLLVALGSAAKATADVWMDRFLWTLILVAAVNTAISLYYYARVIWQMFFVRAEGGPLAGPAGAKVVVATCAVVLLLTGTVAISPLKNRADDYVAGMYAGDARLSGFADADAATELAEPEVTRAANDAVIRPADSATP